MDKLIFSDYQITSPMMSDRTVFGITADHKGTDYGVPMNTLIQSTVSGTVIQTGYDADGFGNYVKIRDKSGNTHIFAHLNEIGVTRGDTVSRFDSIGLSGNTGFSTGAHLHYEVRDSSGKAIDGTLFVNNDYVGSNIYDIGAPATDETLSELGTGKSILATILTFIVMLGIFITAIVSFMKAFDISIPTNISSFMKGGK